MTFSSVCNTSGKIAMKIKPFTLLLVLGAAVSTTSLAHSGATGIVKERMDMFKLNQKHLKAIKSHIRSEDYLSIIKLADEIRDWAVKMPEYFPEGSNEKPSEASPSIWTDFNGFKNALKAFGALLAAYGGLLAATSCWW